MSQGATIDQTGGGKCNITKENIHTVGWNYY